MGQQQSKQRFRYRAVSVHPSIMGACQAAHALKPERFLAAQAPQLPLPDCSNPGGCRCKYQYWDDRRQGDRRAAGADPTPAQAGATERRHRERRRS